jgi:hypothetical protein
MKGLAVIIALLLGAAWRYRNNRPVFFVLVGTLFGVAAVLTRGRVPDAILQALALAWASCMLFAGVFGVADLTAHLRRKKAK